MNQCKPSLFLLGLVGFFVLPSLGFGQSMDVVDRFLQSPLATFDEAVYIILATAELIDTEATSLQAIDEAQKLFPRLGLPADLRGPIKVQAVSYLLVESFDLPKGLMYQLFPGPWYAVREANVLGLYPGNRLAAQSLTPFDVLYGISRAAELRDTE